MGRSQRSGCLAVAALCGLALVLRAANALAYCVEVTEAPPAGYNPAVDGCFSANPDGGFPLPSLFWKSQCVGFSLQRDASVQVPLAEAQIVAEQAFTTWSNVTCPGGGSPSISAAELAPVDCDSVPSELHNNVIMFRDDSWPYDDTANAIGYTTLRVCLQNGCPGDPNALPGEILGADTEINSANYTIITSGTPDAGAGVYDLASILTHEAGHFFGLAHSADSTAVMYAYYHPGSTVPQPDDVAGICALYPPDGTRTAQQGSVAPTTCDPTPLLGFEDQCGSIDASAPSAEAGDAEEPSTDQDTLFGCAMSPGPRSDPAGFAALAVVALGALVRKRRITRRVRSVVAAGGIALGALGATAVASRHAAASVSLIVTFDDLVRRASAVAVVVPIETHSLWEDRHIASYTRARVDLQIAGRLPPHVWIRTLGGDVGPIGERAEGQATFTISNPSLVFLHPHFDPATKGPSGTFGVVEGAQGQFPIVGQDGPNARLALGQNMGALVVPSTSGAARPARDVLRDRLLSDAASEIASAWARAH